MSRFVKKIKGLSTLLGFSLALISFLRPSISQALSPVTISVVQVNGKELSSFLDKEIPKMNLQAYRNGQWRPIPFQIDEKAFDPISRERRWVLQEAFSRRIELPVGDGKLDEYEVILFLMKDLGEKAVPDRSPDHPVAEIQACGGYAYLFFDPPHPLVSSDRYVNYD